MIKINSAAASVMRTIIALLGSRDYVKIDNAPGTYTPVSVDRLGANRFSVAHNTILNGDVMADPDIVFERRGLEFYAVECTQSYVGSYTDGTRDTRAQRSITDLANILLVNIREQQFANVRKVG